LSSLAEAFIQHIAENYLAYVLVVFKDTEQMNIIVQLSDSWREQLACFMERLRDTERAQCKLIQTVLQGITKRLDICTATNR
jgi:hypothetical protein